MKETLIQFLHVTSIVYLIISRPLGQIDKVLFSDWLLVMETGQWRAHDGEHRFRLLARRICRQQTLYLAFGKLDFQEYLLRFGRLIILV